MNSHFQKYNYIICTRPKYYIKIIISFNKISNMSDDGSDNSGEPEVTEEEVAREVEDKCYKAFQAFDQEGSGGEVKSDQVRSVLDHMGIKMNDQVMYRIISEVDP